MYFKNLITIKKLMKPE